MNLLSVCGQKVLFFLLKVTMSYGKLSQLLRDRLNRFGPCERDTTADSCSMVLSDTANGAK